MAAGRQDLIPPFAVVEIARATMGAIDLDAYSTGQVNRVVQAARFLDRSCEDLESILEQDWEPSGAGRLFLGIHSGAAKGRSLANKALREYRAGRLQQGVLWLGANETLALCPWIWDFPVCLPFRRLAPTFWHDELEEPIRVAPSDWSAIAYLPPATSGPAFSNALARFHAAAGGYGRVILDQWSGESRWLDAHQALLRKRYDFDS